MHFENTLLLLNITYTHTIYKRKLNLFRKISLSTCLRVCRFSIRTNKIYPSIHDGPKWATDSRPDLLDNTYVYILYWNLLLLVITRFLIYSTPSLLWLAFTQLFIIALKKKCLIAQPVSGQLYIERNTHFYISWTVTAHMPPTKKNYI